MDVKQHRKILRQAWLHAGVSNSIRQVFNSIKRNRGIQEERGFSWNPSIIDDKKLAPSTMFEKQTELPNVNSSINEGVPASGDKGNEDDVQNMIQTVAKVHYKPAKAKEPSGMGATIWPDGLLKEVIIDGIHYTMTPLDEPKEACVPTTSATVPVSSAKHSKILDEVLTTPVVKKKKTLGVCMSKIPRCISSKDFQKLMRDKEEAKCKEEEEKEDQKQMRQAKAKEKKWQEQAKCEKWELTRVEKAKVAALKALATPHPKRNIK